jgi:hypothetical protein
MIYTNPYTQIVGNMDGPGMIDRTAWMFRKHFKDYMMISFVTFALPLVIFVSLMIATESNYFIAKNYDKLIGLFAAGSIIVFPTCMMLFSAWSEMAVSYYTHKRIHLEEVNWWESCIKTIGLVIPNLFAKALQFIITMVVGIFGVIAMFVPIVGSLLYFWIVVGVYTYLSALFPIITIAERKLRFRERLRRNRSLVSKKTSLCFTMATVGTFILAGLLLLIYLTVGMTLYWIVIPYFKQLSSETMSIRTLMQILSIIFTIVTASVFMVAVPTKSIFYSMVYYSMTSLKDAYHIEYQVKMYHKMTNTEKYEHTV